MGLVYALRWFWWRITAWSEIAALAAGPLTALGLNASGLLEGMPPDAAFAWRLLIIVSTSAVVAVAVTLVAPAEDMDHLRAFYDRVKPPALLWGPVASGQQSPDRFSTMLAQYGLAVAAIFTGMFAIGKLVLWAPAQALLLGGVSVVCWVGLRRMLIK